MIVVDPVAKVEEVVVALVPASSAMKRVTSLETALTRTKGHLGDPWSVTSAIKRATWPETVPTSLTEVVAAVEAAAAPASSATKKVTLPVTALMTRVVTPTNDLEEKMTMVATPGPSQVVTTLDGVTLITATQTGIRTWVPLVAGVRSELDQASLAWTED